MKTIQIPSTRRAATFLDQSQPGQAACPASEALAETRPTEASLRRALEAAGWLQARQAGHRAARGSAGSRRRLVERIHKKARRSWWDSAWAETAGAAGIEFGCAGAAAGDFIVFNFTLFTAAQVALPVKCCTRSSWVWKISACWSLPMTRRRPACTWLFARERSNELQALLLEGEYNYLEITSMQILREGVPGKPILALASDMDPHSAAAAGTGLSLTMEIRRWYCRRCGPSIPANSQAVVNFLLLSAH